MDTRGEKADHSSLVITPAGQLFAISRRLLDPRRPVGAPSADDKEEGLIPYHSAILFNPKEVASYSDHVCLVTSFSISVRVNPNFAAMQVLGADRIKTAPAFLESTSLVLAFGLDVFFTRRMPSKAFDVLSADFSRGSLIATTLALVVAIVVARRMGDQKRVKDAFAS